MKKVEELAKELQKACEEQGYSLLLFSKKEKHVISMMRGTTADLAMAHLGLEKELCEEIGCTPKELQMIALKRAVECLADSIIKEAE